jgi:hypothetical protein
VAVHEAAATTFVQGDGATNPGMLARGVVDSGYFYTNQPSGAKIIQGEEFTSSGTITNPYVKDASGRAYTQRSVIDSVTFNLQRSAYLEFIIEHAAGDDYTQVYNGMILNHWQYVIGEAALLDTDILVPVRDLRDLVTIKFSSDNHLGFSIMSMSWQLRMQMKGRRSA